MEKIVYLETEDGELVRLPESRVDAWIKAQEDVRTGKFRTSEEEAEQMMSLLLTNMQERNR